MRIPAALLILIAVTSAPVTPLAQPYCPDMHWRRQSPDEPLSSIVDIFGISTSSIYAIGGGSDGAVILHFDGVEWTPMDIPATGSLRAVWGSSDTNVYAAGPSGTLLHYDGSAWQALPGSADRTPDFTDVYGGGGKVYLTAGTLICRADATHWWQHAQLQCDGTVTGFCYSVRAAWVSPRGNPCLVGTRQYYEPPDNYGFVYGLGAGSYQSSADLYDVWGTAEDDIYALGTPMYWDSNSPFLMYHSTGGGFTPIAQQPAPRLGRVSGASATDIFGIDADKDLVFYDGTTWTGSAGNPGFNGGALWGSSKSDVYIGGGGLIAHYDGVDFEVTGDSNQMGRAHLYDVWGSTSSDVYAVGEPPGLFHYDGVAWDPMPTFQHTLNGIWGSSPTDILAVGNSGVVQHFDGAQWSETNLDANVLSDVHGRAPNDVYAVGRLGAAAVVYHFNGTMWSAVAGELGSNAQAVFAIPGASVFVGTDENSVWRYDGSGWTEFPNVLPFTQNPPPVLAIWGTSENELFVGGDMGNVALLDGQTGTVVQTWAFTGGAKSLWGTSANDVWAATRYGLIYHFDGTQWVLDTGSGGTLNGIYGVDACSIFAVGIYGTVLHLEPLRNIRITGQLISPSTLLPGQPVTSHFWVEPERAGMEVRLDVTGATTTSATRTTNAAGFFTFEYVPDRMGTASIAPTPVATVTSFVDTLEAQYRAPRLLFDTPPGGSVIPVLPGDEVCTTARVELGIDGIPIDFEVTGFNTAAGTVMSNASGKAKFCYTVDATGVDTIRASTSFAYPLETTVVSATLTLVTVPAPQLVVDERHAGVDSVVTQPDGNACVYFRVTPPMADVTVDYSVSGANTGSGSATSDADGLVEICYPAPAAGVDTVSASGTVVVGSTPVDIEAVLVTKIFQGGSIPLEVILANDFADDFKLRSVVSCNKELDEPLISFVYEKPDGEQTETQRPLTRGAGWTYQATYDFTEMGALEVTASVADLYGNHAVASERYDVVIARSGLALDQSLNGGGFRVTAPSGSVEEDGVLLIDRALAEPPGDPSLEQIGRVFRLEGTARFSSNPGIETRYERPVLPDYDDRKVGIYRWTGSAWVYAGGEAQDGWVGAGLALPGTYGVFYSTNMEIVPQATALFQNYPNPFNPGTTIKFDLHTDGHVELVIYDVTGRRVRTLVNGYRDAGVYFEDWMGQSDAGQPVAAGVYLCRLRAGGEALTRKMILVK